MGEHDQIGSEQFEPAEDWSGTLDEWASVAVDAFRDGYADAQQRIGSSDVDEEAGGAGGRVGEALAGMILSVFGGFVAVFNALVWKDDRPRARAVRFKNTYLEGRGKSFQQVLKSFFTLVILVIAGLGILVLVVRAVLPALMR